MANNAQLTAIKLEEISKVQLDFEIVTDYGNPLLDILSEKVSPPPQGARIDFSAQGSLTGLLAGSIVGRDYVNIRADGRVELNILAQIITEDGAHISFEGIGVGVTQPDGSEPLRLAVKLTTGVEAYSWVNRLTFVAEGSVNAQAGKLEMTLFK